MEEFRIKIRNSLFAANAFLLMLCFSFVFLHEASLIEINHATIFLPLITLLIEAIVFLSTFKYLKTATRKLIVKILVILVSISALITITIVVYERITGYVFLYRYTYGFLLISFLIYPTILLIMLLLINRFNNKRQMNWIVNITCLLTVIFMLFHGVIGGLDQKTMRITENPNGYNTVYLTDSMWLHGTEYEYKQINELFMEYVGISNEW